jgi:hypothetical protein
MSMRSILIGAVAALCLGGGLHAQQKAFDAAAAFGARPSVLDLSLSPDGKRVVYITPLAGQGTAVLTLGVEPNAAPQPAGKISGDLRFISCNWVSNERLACKAYGIQKDPDPGIKGLLPVSRWVAFDTNGGNVRALATHLNSHSYGYLLNDGDIIDWLPEEDGAVLMTRRHLPDDHTGSHLVSPSSGLGVDHIDTRTLAVKTVEPPSEIAAEYITDGHGTVRIMGNHQTLREQLTDATLYVYRVPGSRTWKHLSLYHSNDHSGFLPLAVDRALNVAGAKEARWPHGAVHRQAGRDPARGAGLRAAGCRCG